MEKAILAHANPGKVAYRVVLEQEFSLWAVFKLCAFAPLREIKFFYHQIKEKDR